MVSPSPHSCLSGHGQGALQEPHWAPEAVLVGAVGQAASPRTRAAQDPIDDLLASTCQAWPAQLPRTWYGGALGGGDATDPTTLPPRQPGRADVPGRGLSKGPGTGWGPALSGARCHRSGR